MSGFYYAIFLRFVTPRRRYVNSESGSRSNTASSTTAAIPGDHPYATVDQRELQ
jgi:hypothetical protein